MNEGKRKKGYFFSVFFSLFVTIHVVAVVCGLQYIWNTLVDYEVTRPEHDIKLLLEELNAQDYTRAAALCGYTPIEFEKQDVVEQYLKHHVFDMQTDLSYARESSEEERYAVVRDQANVASILLRASEEKSKFGFSQWEIANMEIRIDTQPDYVITVPQSAKVYLNGQELGERYKTGIDIPVEGFTGLPEGFIPPHKERYTVTGLLFPPEIIVHSSGGVLCDLLPDASLQTAWEAVVRPEKEQLEQWKMLAADVSTVYARYITRDGALADLVSRLMPKTEFRKSIGTFDNKWYIDHDSYSIDKIKIENFNVHSPIYFSCKASFDYHVMKGKHKYDYPSAYILYFAQTDTGWALVNLSICSV